MDATIEALRRVASLSPHPSPTTSFRRPIMKNSPLDRYLADIGRVPLLTREEEVSLARRIARGDQAALDQMIRSNLRLVVTIAKDFAERGLCLEDLVAEGNRGLMKAAERFDPDRGVKFSVYAAHWIKQSIRRALSNQSRTIRLPVHVVEKLVRLERARDAFHDAHQRPPSRTELAKASKLDEKRISLIERTTRRTISLDQPLDSESDAAPLGSTVADPRAGDPLESLEHADLLAKLPSLLDTLEPRERLIIAHRFGLDDLPVRTLEELGAHLGITRERVRQLQVIALRRMRQELDRRDRQTAAGSPAAEGESSRTRQVA